MRPGSGRASAQQTQGDTEVLEALGPVKALHLGSDEVRSACGTVAADSGGHETGSGREEPVEGGRWVAADRAEEGGQTEAVGFRVDKRVGASTPGPGVGGGSGFRFGDSSVPGRPGGGRHRAEGELRFGNVEFEEPVCIQVALTVSTVVLKFWRKG